MIIKNPIKKEYVMGKKSIHKVSPRQKRVKFWDKTVCIIDKMMQKNYQTGNPNRQTDNDYQETL